MWYIHAMEYYSAIKNKDIMNFAGKWMELENIILSEVAQTKMTCMVCSHLYVDISNKKTKTKTNQDPHDILKRPKEAKQKGMPESHLKGRIIVASKWREGTEWHKG